jgi:hypothetical protein
MTVKNVWQYFLSEHPRWLHMHKKDYGHAAAVYLKEEMFDFTRNLH